MKFTSLFCPDCLCMKGQPHRDGCDIERCSICGVQRVSCGGCVGHDPTASGWTGEWPDPDASKLTYHVVEEDFDTRIHRCYGRDVGEFATFGLARDAAVAYLEELIAGCRSALDGIKSADTYEEYARS